MSEIIITFLKLESLLLLNLQVLELAWYATVKVVVEVVEILILKIYKRRRCLQLQVGRTALKRMAICESHVADQVWIVQVRLRETSIEEHMIQGTVSDWILHILAHVRIALYSSCI